MLPARSGGEPGLLSPTQVPFGGSRCWPSGSRVTSTQRSPVTAHLGASKHPLCKAVRPDPRPWGEVSTLWTALLGLTDQQHSPGSGAHLGAGLWCRRPDWSLPGDHTGDKRSPPFLAAPPWLRAPLPQASGWVRVVRCRFPLRLLASVCVRSSLPLWSCLISQSVPLPRSLPSPL